MSQLQTNKDINAVLIGLQQNSGRVRAFTAIAGKQSSWLVDPDSTLTKQFTIGSLPVNYFVDRTGVIRNIVSGVLNKQEVLAYLKNL